MSRDRPSDPPARPAAQIPLDVRLRESARFETFVPGSDPAALRAAQRVATGEEAGVVYLWGRPGTGKTHLLQAACQAAGAAGARAACIALARLPELSPRLLEDLAALDLVCLDDLDRLAGRPAWERAVLHLYNEITAAEGRLLVAAAAAPGACRLALPDLASRLAAGLVLRLRELTDGERIAVLRSRARDRGIALPEPVARYALARVDRDMHSLMAFLDALDASALAAQRRVTLPFVRRFLAARR